MPTSHSHITVIAPAVKVWEALTKPELVKQWQYGSDLVTTWKPGSRISFRAEWGGQVFEQWGTVLEYSPPTHLKYSLFAPRPGLADIPENYFHMVYTLDERDGATRLTITQHDDRPGAEASPSESSDAENPVLAALKSLAESL